MTETFGVGTNTWVIAAASFKSASSPPPAGDTTPPTVSITAPAGGSTVSGSSLQARLTQILEESSRMQSR
jgi:hypothetical protein